MREREKENKIRDRKMDKKIWMYGHTLLKEKLS